MHWFSKVAYNNLSGVIPSNEQFCTFNKRTLKAIQACVVRQWEGIACRVEPLKHPFITVMMKQNQESLVIQ
ncbi:hypothetical protein QJS10_CPB19g01249 [Acorus calamus]|uniref:Uncharacterized protein n=1 Tax=Acorus calamus TaxID=4465 RepID=A0AAV9CEY2_ACOCL|nr:hypothetical protein QJS10_CPB19g01249 [Acorus calamus]